MPFDRWFYAWRARLRRACDRERTERELHEELESHLAQEIEARRARGVPSADARRQALAALGGVESVKESVRETRPGASFEQLAQDVRYGLRLLRRNPALATATILTLALGIGAATTVFSVVDAVLLQPPPFPEPERIVTVWQTDPQNGNQSADVAPANFLDWRYQAHSYEQLAAMEPTSLDFTGGDEPEVFLTSLVSEGFFQVLGVTAARGRTFLPEEFARGNRPVVILTDGLWRRRFGADPDLVGQSLRLDGQLYTVVGVLPPGFHLGLASREREAFVPKIFEEYESYLRASSWWHVVGRLRPGVTVAEAQAEMTAITGRLALDHPRTNTGVGARVIPLHARQVAAVRPALFLLAGAVAFFLVIACVNTAGLTLAHNSRRRAEFAVRMALGGGRTRLLRQLITESVVVAALGAGGGIALAAGALDLVAAFGPADVPRLQDLTIDTRILGFATLLVVVTTIGFAGAPAVQAIREQARAIVHGQRSGATPRERRLRAALVTAEVAFTLVLLVGAGLLAQSLARLLDVDLGFAPENTIAMQVVAWDRHDDGAARANFVRQTLQRIRALPGIEAAGAASSFPLAIADFTMESTLTILNRPPPPPGEESSTAVSIASPAYPETMRIPVRRGRWFDDRDDNERPVVAVINETLARQHWPDRDPVSDRVSVQFGGRTVEAEIVGVVGSVRPRGFDSQPRPELFLPHAQVPHGEMTYLVRAESDPATVISAVQRAVWSVDPLQAFYSVATVDQLLRDTMATRRFTSRLLALFGFMALVLAAVGIYGVIGEATNQRTREFGVRTALGAPAGAIVGMVVAGALRLALTGVALGLIAALALSQSISHLLFEVAPTDLMTFLTASLLLLAVAVVAASAPARRATRVDPVSALRVG